MITNIPKHWKIKKLGEIGKVKMCKRIFKDQTNKDSNGIPFYKIGTFGGIPDAFISKELYNEYKNKYPYPKKGDVLISAAGTIGRLVVFDGTPSYFQDSNIIWIENDENIALNKYLYHLYSNVKWKTTEGGIVSRLYNADIESLELPIPPLEEQEKIAEMLLTCDKAIRLTTQIITQLKQRNQGLAQQLLTGEKRVKGFEKSVWKEVKLGELLDYEQPTNYLVKNTDYSNEYKIPVLTAGKTFILGYTNEKEGICTNIPLILFDDFTTDSRYIDFPFKVKSSAVKLLKTKKNVNLRFIFEAMKLIKYAIGGHERHWISKYAFLTIFVPSFKEQNAIAQILDTAHQELKLYEQKLQLLQAQKKTLMQKLLTGEVLTLA